MTQIRHEDLAGGGKAVMSQLQLLHDADQVFIRDVTTEEMIPVYGVVFNRDTTKANPQAVFIELDTTNESDLLRILEHVRLLKGHQEYFGYPRKARIGTSDAERERDELMKLFLTVQSSRGEFIEKLKRAALSPTEGIEIRHPRSFDVALEGIPAEMSVDALHQVSLMLAFTAPMMLDVRENMPLKLAEAIREMGLTLAARCEELAVRLEQVPNEPFRSKAKGYEVRDSETGELKFQHVIWELARGYRETYEKTTGRKAELSPVPIEESYSLQRFIDGVRGKSILDMMLDGDIRYPGDGDVEFPGEEW